MFPNLKSLPKGFALPAAIFVLVTVAAMVLAMVRLSAGQAAGSVWSLLVARAYWAAETGLEWGVMKVLADNSCGGFPATKTVDSFSIILTCSATVHTEDLVDRTRYKIVAKASTTGAAVASPDYVYKELEAVVID